MQVVWEAQEEECINCQQGGGLFLQCAKVPDLTPDCANCHWNNQARRCSFLHSEASPQSPEVAAPPAPVLLRTLLALTLPSRLISLTKPVSSIEEQLAIMSRQLTRLNGRMRRMERAVNRLERGDVDLSR